MGKDLKGKELGKGITQRKDGRYQARFTDRFGKRRCVYGTTLKEVKNELKSEITDDFRKNNVANPNMTLDQWYEKWLKVYKKPSVKETTLYMYIRVYKKISPVLGKYRISEITNLMITDYLNDLANKFHKNTVHNYRTVLYDLFKYAVNNKLCTENPAQGIKLYGSETKQVIALSTQDQKDFFLAAKGKFYYNLFVVAVNTGLRSGELRALTLDDIDLKNNIINVNKTLSYLGITNVYDFNGNKINTPKTKASVRTVPINKNCREALEAQINQLKTLPPIGYDTKSFGHLLFVTRNNTPIMHESYNGAIQTVIKIANKSRQSKNQNSLPSFTTHTFRHTFATRCFEAGIPPKTVQAYLGHNSLQMTMDTYTSVLEAKKNKDIKLLENIMP